MTHEFCDCIIIIYPYIINTDRVVMCGGHGKLQTKRNNTFLNIHEPTTQYSQYTERAVLRLYDALT